jgi:hypothetical protein
MFAGENQTLHAHVFRGADDLVRVEIDRVEHPFAFITLAHFPVRKRIHGEMKEAIKLIGLPNKLRSGRYQPTRRRRFDGRRRSGGQH